MALVTIFTDASYCPRSNVGGWGAWYKADDMKYGELMGGHIKEVTSSNSAELKAIAKALDAIVAQGYIKRGDAVMIQSDSEWALQCVLAIPGVRQKAKDHVVPQFRDFKPDESTKDILSNISQIINTNGLRIFIRHVKGHQGGGSGRSWVNEACNAVAQRHLKTLRAKAHVRKKRNVVGING